MTTETQKITKKDVLALLHRYEGVSQKILEHPKFDDVTRESAADQTALYILVLKEIIDVDSDELPHDLVVVVTLAAGYAKLVDDFCASPVEA